MPTYKINYSGGKARVINVNKLPNKTTLQSLDRVYLGQPFVNLVSKFQDTRGLDTTYLGQPFYGHTDGFSINTATDPDAENYLIAVENQDGQLLEESVKWAIRSFIFGCKRDGIWSALGSCCILMGARTLAGALVPLQGSAPTNNNFINTDYSRKTGLKGDGSTKYLDANRLVTTDPNDSCHLSIYVTQTETRAYYPLIGYGGFQINGSFSIQTGSVTANLGFYQRQSGFDNRTGANSNAGFKGLSRSGSTNTQRYNGLSFDTTTNATSPASINHSIFTSRNASGVIGGISDQRLSFYSIGPFINIALLDNRVSALYNAITLAIP